MKGAKHRMRAVLAAALVPLFVGSTYNWDTTSDGDWNDNSNWAGASPGFPDDIGDDAVVDEAITITLAGASVTNIDDLTIDYGDFGGPVFSGGDPATLKTLACDSVTIVGGTSGTTASVEDLAKITAN